MLFDAGPGVVSGRRAGYVLGLSCDFHPRHSKVWFRLNLPYACHSPCVFVSAFLSGDMVRSNEAYVYDLDSSLPFPCRLDEYVRLSFRPEMPLLPIYERYGLVPKHMGLPSVGITMSLQSTSCPLQDVSHHSRGAFFARLCKRSFAHEGQRRDPAALPGDPLPRYVKHIFLLASARMQRH